METFNNILKLSAGIGLFLFAMHLLEESLKNLSGRSFKIFLQKMTKSKLGAVSGGAIVTAVLQSSSMVSLMVLAFVGAGVFTIKNAMAVILGANLGTTLASWMVAVLGFKINIEVIAYPAACLGGILLIALGKYQSIKYIAYLLFGFGLLFIGLSYMKTAMEVQVNGFDLTKYAYTSSAIFLGIGFVLTVLVQSSSVTMALTLSALNAGVIEFPAAAAIVLGSETGTTIKLILGAIGGNSSKKKVVLSNIIFNVVLTVLVFIFLRPILLLITEVFGIGDPLIGLVVFSSLNNLFAIILFLPFIDFLANFLEKIYTNSDDFITAFINNANINESETALDLFRRETAYFIHNSQLFNLELFQIDTATLQQKPEYKGINEKRNFNAKTVEEKYEFLKQLQGELQLYYLELRTKLQGEQLAQLNQLISAVRSAMHSVKSVKDINFNITNLRRSSKDIKYKFYIFHKDQTKELYLNLDKLVNQKEKISFEKLLEIYDSIQSNFSSSLNNFYKDAREASILDIDLTTVINFNRELFTSNKAILIAVKDFLLDEKLATEFNEKTIYRT